MYGCGKMRNLKLGVSIKQEENRCCSSNIFLKSAYFFMDNTEWFIVEKREIVEHNIFTGYDLLFYKLT